MPHSSNAARLPRLASWWKGLDTPPAPAAAAPSASAALPPRSNAPGGAAGDRDGAVAMMRRTANHELSTGSSPSSTRTISTPVPTIC